ncbi:MAG TPA: M28 family peptidase [Gemmatimonadaceae bacterium]|nr:M28 family peptidase [Gemmatimonadaceae bacterium]
MADPELVQCAKDLVERLSRKPRFAGSPEEGEARALCRSELERAGFECVERPFEYSQWPGRWGPPIAAAFQAITILVVAHVAVHDGPLVALVVGAALLTALMFASGNAKRRWTARFPWQRARSANLEAKRGNPGVWLVAHIDSKSQTVPMLFRIASSVALAIITASAFIVLLLSLVGVSLVLSVWHLLAIAAVVGALPSIFCFVRNDSNGALDNASGVAAVLIASQSTSTSRDLGVLITSGEELGLAGARAWAAAAGPGMLVINCDTVDDAGGWRCMYTGPRPGRIAGAAETIAGRQGLKLTVGRLIPGILADSIAFADRGIESVTVSRGTLSTLARIHTRRDNSNAFTGSGVAEASVLLAALTKELA